MATVYLAYDKKHDRNGALKIVYASSPRCGAGRDECARLEQMSDVI
jgi:hypothetical protein